MVPTRALLIAWATAFRAYWVGQLQAPGWAFVMSKTPFAPGPNLVNGDYTADVDWQNFPFPISDTGYQVGTDPRDGSIVVAASGPAGVPAHLSTSATARTIYGWVMGSVGPFTAMASELLPAPISVAAVDAQIFSPNIAFRFPPTMVR